jgi:hypothetical protein
MNKVGGVAWHLLTKQAGQRDLMDNLEQICKLAGELSTY